MRFPVPIIYVCILFQLKPECLCFWPSNYLTPQSTFPTISIPRIWNCKLTCNFAIFWHVTAETRILKNLCCQLNYPSSGFSLKFHNLIFNIFFITSPMKIVPIMIIINWWKICGGIECEDCSRACKILKYRNLKFASRLVNYAVFWEYGEQFWECRARAHTHTHAARMFLRRLLWYRYCVSFHCSRYNGPSRETNNAILALFF